MAGTSALLARGASPSEERRPDVLLIFVDDLRPWLGCYAPPFQVRTPNIDEIARQGARFDRAYCTSPACLPSRTALLTGIAPWKSGVVENGQFWRTALPEALTLSAHFARHGYHTIGQGKLHHGADAPEYVEHGPTESSPKPSMNRPGMLGNPIECTDAEIGDARVVSRAIDSLRRAPPGKPVFLAVGLIKAHLPWDLPAGRWPTMAETHPKPSIRSADLDDVPPIGRSMAEHGNGLEKAVAHNAILSADTWSANVAAYIACIEFVDAQIGRVLDAWRTSGRSGYIVLCSDHGWHLGEKEHWSKFTLWEEATRVPLIISGPRIAAGGRGQVVSNLDIFPSLCALAKLPLPEQVDGTAITGILADPDARPTGRPAITFHGSHNVAVRSERWRYIRYSDSSDELYDHENDPHETRNLAGDPATAGVRAFLRGQIPEIRRVAPFSKGRRSSFGSDGRVTPTPDSKREGD